MTPGVPTVQPMYGNNAQPYWNTPNQNIPVGNQGNQYNTPTQNWSYSQASQIMKPQVNWNQYMRENDPAMNHLTEQFVKTQAHQNYQRNDRMYQGGNNCYSMERPIRRYPKCQGTHQERICPTTICFRCQGTGHLANTYNRPLRCQKCGEEGHTDRRYNSETVRMAQPSQRQAQNNVV